MQKQHNKNAKTALVLFSVAGGMVGLAFASVPLYQLFCQVTGFGGTPKIATASAVPAGNNARELTIRFDANVNPALPWRFSPEHNEIRVRAGVPMEINYLAKNISDESMTGTATFNVTPYKAAEYFSKIDCFCFTEQRLAAGKEASMGVQFFIDPEIFTDPNTRDVKVITLSYTFFRAKDASGKSVKPTKTSTLVPTKAGPSI